MRQIDQTPSDSGCAGFQLVLERKAPRMRRISALIRVRQAIAARNDACCNTNAMTQHAVVADTPQPACTRAQAKRVVLMTPTTASTRYEKTDAVMPVKIANRTIKGNIGRLRESEASQTWLNKSKTIGSFPWCRSTAAGNTVCLMAKAMTPLLEPLPDYRETPPSATFCVSGLQ
jgi:hypothetical protein